eukprot:TRINITY_DN3465_c0_g1_i1.p2 TRINITY_DN3465_c0_g1~~TRINITY_DN3465_c0_g1_i1.p2  ORF type:complete len:108 (+),score=3.20 TRINITY_DN3465_c0_g1_i1:67-390(+)
MCIRDRYKPWPHFIKFRTPSSISYSEEEPLMNISIYMINVLRMQLRVVKCIQQLQIIDIQQTIKAKRESVRESIIINKNQFNFVTLSLSELAFLELEPNLPASAESK